MLSLFAVVSLTLLIKSLLEIKPVLLFVCQLLTLFTAGNKGIFYVGAEVKKNNPETNRMHKLVNDYTISDS